MLGSISRNRHLSRWGALAADGLTLLRGLLALVIVGLGVTQGAAALPTVVYLATAGWVVDWVDGPLARLCGRPTLLGRFDFAIDAGLTWACFVYSALAGYIPAPVVVVYTLLAGAAFLGWRRRVVLMLFMRGIDALLVLVVLRNAAATLIPLAVSVLVFGVIRRRRVRQQLGRALHDLRTLAGSGNHRSPEDIS